MVTQVHKLHYFNHPFKLIFLGLTLIFDKNLHLKTTTKFMHSCVRGEQNQNILKRFEYLKLLDCFKKFESFLFSMLLVFSLLKIHHPLYSNFSKSLD